MMYFGTVHAISSLLFMPRLNLGHVRLDDDDIIYRHAMA